MEEAQAKADVELACDSPTPQEVQEENPRAVKSLVWKQDIHIIPLASWTYFLCSLDRGNIGNARILNHSHGNDLLTETNMTQYQFIIALMVFLIAYGLFEVPSNILLKKFRPSRWIGFLMFSWGAITIGLGGVQAFWSVTLVRFLLGVFEAGLFPGLVFYITHWYKSEERSIRVALILASATLAGAFGGAIAYGIGHMNQVGGHSGWRWLFILEGVPSCLSAILVWFFLPDYPDIASFLSPEEKALAQRRLALDGSKSGGPSMTKADAMWVLKEPRLYLHYIVYFGISVPFSSLSLFTPSITAGLGFYDLQAQLMSVPPYAAAYVVQVLTSWSADHFNARAIHSATLATVGAAGFIGSALLPAESYTHRYGCLIVAASGSFACIPPLLGWLSSNVFSGPAVGMAIALNIGLGGAPGQIAGVWIYKANEASEGYPTGHWTNAALLMMVAVGCMILRFWYIHLNKRRQTDEPVATRMYVY